MIHSYKRYPEGVNDIALFSKTPTSGSLTQQLEAAEATYQAEQERIEAARAATTQQIAEETKQRKSVVTARIRRLESEATELERLEARLP